MNSINLKKFLMGTGGVTPPATVLAKLTFTDNTTNNVLDSNANFKLSDNEARSGISVGQSYATIKKVNIWSDCIEVSLQSFRNYSGYNWNPIDGVSFSSASSLEVIGDYAFSGWTSANFGTILNMPSKLKTIGVQAFHNWSSNLYGVNLANATSLTDIGYRAFEYWKTSACLVIIPSNVKSLGVASFTGWTSNTSGVNLAGASSLTDINKNVFMSWNLANMDTDLIIPSNVKIIDNNAFSGWEVMTKGVNFTNAASLSAIGENTFAWWTSATMTTNLVIPNKVESIGFRAFLNWNSMTNGVDLSNATSLKFIKGQTFNGWLKANMTTNLTIPPNVITIDPQAFGGWNLMQKGVSFSGESLLTIGDSAFSGWSKAVMTSDIVIPSSVTYIGAGAFGAWWINPFGMTFNSVNPPTFGEYVYFQWGIGVAPYTNIKLTVPVSANLSTWKTALGITNNVHSINGVLWDLIP